MGLLDKLKGAVNAVTGGAAKVTIEFQPQTAFPGEQIMVKISATSTGKEVKSKGVFVDLRSVEQASIKKDEANSEHDVHLSKTIFEKAFQIAPALVLAPNETKLFEGAVQLPTADVQPTFVGHYVRHNWEIRGRLEAFGNDPDSGFKPIRVGLKA